jgi:LysR family glycine cleavage system transcriptional activator
MNIDWRHLPPLSALRAFAALAEAGSFSAAARRLNVTHAAVAQQVRALEEHLGVTLAVRDGRSLALTAEGGQLAAALAEGFGAVQRGVLALRDQGADRPVKVTLTPGFAVQWLMPRLRDFWERHPDIGLSLHPENRVVDLRRDGMDLGIRYGRGKWPGVQAAFLASARLVVAAAPEVTGGRSGLTPAQMAGMEWIAARDWPEQDDYLRSIGLDPAALSKTEFPNEELSIAAARQGLGLVVESLALIEDDLRTGRLVLVHDSHNRLPAYFVVTLPGPQRPQVRAFLKWLEGAA